MAMAIRRIVLVLLVALPLQAIAADKVTTVPVHFAKGASNATMQGSFSGYDTVEYTLGARAGQTMTVSIAGSGNANFNVFPPGAKPGEASALGNGYVGSDWSGTLPDNGSYRVQVFQMRASARRGEKVPYTITFAIGGAAHHGAGAGHAMMAMSASERAGRGMFDASGQVPCAQHRGQPMMQCAFQVARGAGGSATVVITRPDGLKRAIFFEGGRPVSADLSQADGNMDFSSSQDADLFHVNAGDERYEIPEAVVTGG